MKVQVANRTMTFRFEMRRSGPWLIFLVIALLILLVPSPFSAKMPVDRKIRIEASTSQFNPAIVQVNPGDRVTIELVSTDVVHGFSLDNYNFSLTADPGQTATGTFIASQPGVFRFRCPVPCGNLHPFMIGEMKVGPDLTLLRGLGLSLLVAIAGTWSFNRDRNE